MQTALTHIQPGDVCVYAGTVAPTMVITEVYVDVCYCHYMWNGSHMQMLVPRDKAKILWHTKQEIDKIW